jgi:hypothetical protein
MKPLSPKSNLKILSLLPNEEQKSMHFAESIIICAKRFGREIRPYSGLVINTTSTGK